MFIAFVPTKAVLVRKNRQFFKAYKPKAPSGRELPTKSGEGERVTIQLVQIQSYAGSFRHASRATASACGWHLGGRLCCRPTVHQKGVTHYTLQSKACEKEYEQIVRTPYVVGRGFISRRIIKFLSFSTAAASHRPTMFATGKPAL